MMLVKLANSGVALNRAALRGCRAFPGSGVSGILERRPSAMRHLSFFPSQLFVSDSSTQALAHPKDESVNVICVPVIKPKGLLIDVAEQMEWFNRNVGSIMRPFKETPKVLDSVRLNIATNIFFRVINNALLVLAGHPPIVSRFVTHKVGTFPHVAANVAALGWRCAVIGNGCANFATALKGADNGSLAASVAALLLNLGLAPLVHVPGFAADQGFVDLDNTVQFAARGGILHCQPDSVEHKPCGFLGAADPLMNLVGRNTVLVVQNLPDRRKPLLKRDRRILKYGSRLQVPAEAALSLLNSHEEIIQPIEFETYGSFEPAARTRIASRDPEDWPVLATALALRSPIWTEDNDCFGAGVATWTPDRVELFLAAARRSD
jgi:hypothetical protein